MLPIILAAFSSQAAPDTTPTITSFGVATLTAGSCAGNTVDISASLRATWAATNFNPTLHKYSLYINNILETTTTGTSYDKEVSGLVEGNPRHPVSKHWTYRLDIVRLSDSAVLASSSVSVTKSYGDCNSGGGA